MGHSIFGLISEHRNTKGIIIYVLIVLNIYIYAPLKLPFFFYEYVVCEFWRSVLKKICHMPTLFCVSEGTEVPCAWGLESESQPWVCGKSSASFLPLELMSAKLTSIYRKNTSAFKN